MTTTDKKPRVKTPPAEVVGSFEDVMRRPKCKDGRSLFMFRDTSGETELFVEAGSELQTLKALLPHLGTIQKMTQGRMDDRQRVYILKNMEEQNGEKETQPAGEV